MESLQKTLEELRTSCQCRGSQEDREKEGCGEKEREKEGKREILKDKDKEWGKEKETDKAKEGTKGVENIDKDQERNILEESEGERNGNRWKYGYTQRKEAYQKVGMFNSFFHYFKISS